MKRKKILRLFLALFLSCHFLSCSPQSGKNDVFLIVPSFTLSENSSNDEFNTNVFHDISNVNQDLTIVKFPSAFFDYPDLDNFIAGYVVSNNSKNAILIPKENLSVAYAYYPENGSWIKVNQLIEYLFEPEPLELQPFTNDWVNVGLIKVYLEPSLVSSVEFVRLVVIGQSSGSGELVGAWLDVPWQPAD